MKPLEKLADVYVTFSVNDECKNFWPLDISYNLSNTCLGNQMLSVFCRISVAGVAFSLLKK